MRELFVYYRVRTADSALASVAAQAMQAQLRTRHPELIARLLCRPDTGGGEQTWMETYAADPARRCRPRSTTPRSRCGRGKSGRATRRCSSRVPDRARYRAAPALPVGARIEPRRVLRAPDRTPRLVGAGAG
jgi:hypothetical protein